MRVSLWCQEVSLSRHAPISLSVRGLPGKQLLLYIFILFFDGIVFSFQLGCVSYLHDTIIIYCTHYLQVSLFTVFVSHFIYSMFIEQYVQILSIDACLYILHKNESSIFQSSFFSFIIVMLYFIYFY